MNAKFFGQKTKIRVYNIRGTFDSDLNLAVTIFKRTLREYLSAIHGHSSNLNASRSVFVAKSPNSMSTPLMGDAKLTLVSRIHFSAFALTHPHNTFGIYFLGGQTHLFTIRDNRAATTLRKVSKHM